MLYVTTEAEWSDAGPDHFVPAELRQQGSLLLLHGQHAMRKTSEHASGRLDLVLLVVDPAALRDELRGETEGARLYSPLPLAAVRATAALTPGPDSSYELPESARLAELELLALSSFEAVLERCHTAMAGFDGPWWVGGGWACDAATGKVNRPHLDIDVVVLRPDQDGLAHFVAGWDVRIPDAGKLHVWDGRRLEPAEHQLWLRPADGHRPERWPEFAVDPHFFEILFEQVDHATGMWEFRRNAAVRDNISRFGPPGGFLRPEVALLYKAAGATSADPAAVTKTQVDFDHTAPHLDTEQRDWLARAIRTTATDDHPWLARLAR